MLLKGNLVIVIIIIVIIIMDVPALLSSDGVRWRVYDVNHQAIQAPMNSPKPLIDSNTPKQVTLLKWRTARAWPSDHATSSVTAVLPPPGQRCGTVCLNSFGNRTSPSDNYSNDRWKRLCLV